MTDLHRYVDHGNFQPPWDELRNESLGDRLLLVHSLGVGHRTVSEMTVAASESGTVCRISLFRSNDFGVRGSILFEHGSVKPIGYTGAGACAAEPPPEKGGKGTLMGRQVCRFNKGASISLHGLAWRGERETEQGAKSLSQKRAEYIRDHLEGTALPQDLTRVEAHGMTRTDVQMPSDGPVPGVYLALDNPGISKAKDPFRFHNASGPPIPDHVREQLASFMDTYASRPNVPPVGYHSTKMSVDYIAPGGGRAGYYGEPFDRERRALSAVYRWAEALTKAGCRYDEVKAIEAFLPEDERRK